MAYQCSYQSQYQDRITLALHAGVAYGGMRHSNFQMQGLVLVESV